MSASGFTPPQIRRCLSDFKVSVLRPPCLHAEKRGLVLKVFGRFERLGVGGCCDLPLL